MADLYSVISELSPSQQDILEAELFTKQVIEARYPDIDLREGTGLRDLLIRPNAFFIALVKKGIESYLAQNTVQGVDDSSTQEVVDSLMSNWFATRDQGTYAVINARLYFARQKNVTIPMGTSFSPDGALQYYPSSTTVLSASALTYDGSSNEWYVDIDLQASDPGTAYNLGEGSLLYFSTFDPYFLHAEINYLVSESRNGETNTEFLSRVGSSISTRNLVNQPSVVSNLQGEFNYLDKIVVVGAGEPDMMRDQVKLVFDQEATRQVSVATWASSAVTVTLSNHGFFTGQTITVSSGIPIAYNGSYTITVLDDNRFTYPLGSNPGAVTTLPFVQSVTAPVYAHLGGKVDVYCGNVIEQALVQLTLDSTGSARVYGPVLDAVRSSISAGATSDTLPASIPLSFSSPVYNSGANSLTFTVLSHGLTGTPSFDIEGISQTVNISAISCANKLVTVTASSHGMTTGDYARIEGVSPSEYNGVFQVTVLNSNQFTYVPRVDIFTAGSGSVMKATNPLLTGVFTGSVSNSNTLVATLPNLWSGTPAGTLTIASVIPFTLSKPISQQATLVSLTCSGNLATASLQGHGLVRNRFITISGCSVSGYNGTWQVESVLDGDTFTFATTSVGLASAGSATMTYTSPSKDLTFSSRQILDVKFPAAQAGKTVTMQLSQFKNLESVQDYLDANSVRILCGDYLARGFNCYVLDLDLASYNGPTPSSGLADSAAASFLKSMQPGEPLILSDLASALSAAGINNLQTPIGVSYKFYHRDLVSPTSGTIYDYLDPLDPTSIFVLGNVTCSSLAI